MCHQLIVSGLPIQESTCIYLRNKNLSFFDFYQSLQKRRSASGNILYVLRYIAEYIQIKKNRRKIHLVTRFRCKGSDEKVGPRDKLFFYLLYKWLNIFWSIIFWTTTKMHLKNHWTFETLLKVYWRYFVYVAIRWYTLTLPRYTPSKVSINQFLYTLKAY